MWASGRQALCDSLSYYQAYQSAAYQKDNIVRGFLIDQTDGDLAFLDEEVIITRAGGGRGRDANGEIVKRIDHTANDREIRCVIRNMEEQIPLVMIVGSNNADAPAQIPHRYCVLDHFRVTNVWTEKKDGKIEYKYRFEKVDLATRSWWSPEGAPDPLPLNSRDSRRAHREDCDDCHNESIQVYKEGWMCLNKDCKAFWKQGWKSGGSKVHRELTYLQEFVQARLTGTARQTPPFAIKPPPAPANAGNEPTYSFSQMCWKGMVCPDCGRCSSRALWDKWECGNDNCKFVYKLNQPILSSRAVMDPRYPLYQGHALPVGERQDNSIEMGVNFIGHWRVTTYTICPGNTVTHFQSNQPLNELPRGADKIFMEVQKDNCLGLKRHQMSGGIGKSSESISIIC